MTTAELRALVAKNPRGLVDLINIAGAMPALLDRLEAASLALHEIATRPNATPGELQTSAYEAYDAARAGK